MKEFAREKKHSTEPKAQDSAPPQTQRRGGAGATDLMSAAQAGDPASIKMLQSAGNRAIDAAFGPEAEKKSLGRLAEVNPAVAVKLARSTGKDVGDAEVKVEPELEASGKRGVAREGREIGVGSESAALDARLMAHEGGHVVQQRGGSEKGEGTVGEPEGAQGASNLQGAAGPQGASDPQAAAQANASVGGGASAPTGMADAEQEVVAAEDKLLVGEPVGLRASGAGELFEGEGEGSSEQENAAQAQLETAGEGLVDVAPKSAQGGDKKSKQGIPTAEVEAFLGQFEARVAGKRVELDMQLLAALSEADPIAAPHVEAQHTALVAKLGKLTANFHAVAGAMQKGVEESDAQVEEYKEDVAVDSTAAPDRAVRTEEEVAWSNDVLKRLQNLDGEFWVEADALGPVLSLVPKGYRDALHAKEDELTEAVDAMHAEIDTRAQEALAKVAAAKDLGYEGDNLEEQVEAARARSHKRVAEVTQSLLDQFEGIVAVRDVRLGMALAELETEISTDGVSAGSASRLAQLEEQNLADLSSAQTDIKSAFPLTSVVVGKEGEFGVERKQNILGLDEEVQINLGGKVTGDDDYVGELIPDMDTRKLIEQIERYEALAGFFQDTMIEGIKSQDPTNWDNLAMSAAPFALVGVLKLLKSSRRLLKVAQETGGDGLLELSKQRKLPDVEVDELGSLLAKIKREEKLVPDEEVRLKSLLGKVDGAETIRPEAKYFGSKKHGISWKEGPKLANDVKVPQGQWGSKADLDFASEMAATLEPRQSGWFELPPGSTSLVHMPDGTTKAATKIFVRNNGTGTFHGYPAL